MDSIILALLVTIFVWLFMRQRRLKQLRRVKEQQADAGEQPKTMPRIGTPGSVTKEQLQRLKESNFEPGRWWSREEADLILDSVAYLRAAITQATGEADAPDDVQNKILAFILTDEELRQYVISWGENRRNKGITGPPDELRRNEQYERIEAFIRGLHEDE